ncbi:hypothetical protein E2562_032906 [Oryza meyeriana var. granulata]|uniref:Uncharacterized protein n=1 Tax=Oryza meyeriana var. granulata TaxID=110450 RepID=A0A6G1F0T3_9ORYZ|nr:hypothetical protein E2562_032906 [Oryza meyeriana var. granulata]
MSMSGGVFVDTSRSLGGTVDRRGGDEEERAIGSGEEGAGCIDRRQSRSAVAAPSTSGSTHEDGGAAPEDGAAGHCCPAVILPKRVASTY